MEALVPHERFRCLLLPAEFTGRKARSAPVKIIPTARDCTFWLCSGERLSADGRITVRTPKLLIRSRFDETAAPELLPAGDGLYSRRNS